MQYILTSTQTAVCFAASFFYLSNRYLSGGRAWSCIRRARSQACCLYFTFFSCPPPSTRKPGYATDCHTVKTLIRPFNNENNNENNNYRICTTVLLSEWNNVNSCCRFCLNTCGVINVKKIFRPANTVLQASWGLFRWFSHTNQNLPQNIRTFCEIQLSKLLQF